MSFREGRGPTAAVFQRFHCGTTDCNKAYKDKGAAGSTGDAARADDNKAIRTQGTWWLRLTRRRRLSAAEREVREQAALIDILVWLVTGGEAADPEIRPTGSSSRASHAAFRSAPSRASIGRATTPHGHMLVPA